MHGCAHMGTHASGRSSRYDIFLILIASLASRSSHDHPSAVNVHLPKDRISMAHQGFGFCEFLTEEDAEYACKIMNQIKLWGKPIRVNKASCFECSFGRFILILYCTQASSDKKQLDVGANLFIGNLDENVDERLLYDTFSAFGMMATTAKVRPCLKVLSSKL